ECIDVQSSVDHCGACTTPCPSPGTHEAAICTLGNCSVQCIAPYADCDGLGSNGCETNLQTSASSCGVCGRTCNGGTCTTGACSVTTYGSGAELTGLALDATYVYWAD